MLVRRLRFPRSGQALAALAGFLLFGPTALAQSPQVGAQPYPGAVRPQVPYGQAPEDSSMAGQVPRVAQTPQSPTESTFSDLTGAVAAPPPVDYLSPEAAWITATGPSAAGGAPAFAGFGSAFAPGLGLAGQGATTLVADNVGYIDSAIIRSRIRVRFDANFDDTSPDKAEFIYAKCGCFANPANFSFTLTAPTPVKSSNGMIHIESPSHGKVFDYGYALAHGYDPRARGPVLHGPVPGHPNVSTFGSVPSINYQEVATYLEYAPVRNFSAFIELPARFLQPSIGTNTAGFSDLNLGSKYAFIANPNQYYTFQFRVYAPTGNSYQGLGTGHVTLEPGLLVFQRLSDRLYFSGQFLDWIPVGGSDFAGNILIYGVGLTYNIVLTDHLRIAPVNEFVGWTILNGQEYVMTKQAPSGTVLPVGGQSILNEKIGLRIGLGNYSQAGGGSALNDRHSLYVGYGVAVTGDAWYRQTFRLEYNLWF